VDVRVEGREAGDVQALSASYNQIVTDGSTVQGIALQARRPAPTVGLRGLQGLQRGL
jgi:hypothetical protein